MNETAIVKNIGRLSGYIDDAYLKSEQDKFVFLQSDFNVFHQQIKALFDIWFPKSKLCKDEDIINQIFVDNIEEKDAKTWVKYSLLCLLGASARVFENIKKAKTDDEKQLFLCELDFLKEMSLEASILMEISFKVVERKDLDFGRGKRFHIFPRETFNASRQILRKYTARRTLGDFVFSPSSIFLIRQSIELWLQSIFAINIALDATNKIIKLQPERLFDLLDNKGVKVELPVSKIVIQKIHKWTQAYVHAGWLAYTWEIEHAQHVLQPIFNPSNVKIDRTHFENIESQLRTILKNPTLTLQRLSRSDSTIKN